MATFEKRREYKEGRDMDGFTPLTLWRAGRGKGRLLEPFTSRLPRLNVQDVHPQPSPEMAAEGDDQSQPTRAGAFLFGFLGIASATVGGYLIVHLSEPWNMVAAVVAFAAFSFAFCFAEDELACYEAALFLQEQRQREKVAVETDDAGDQEGVV